MKQHSIWTKEELQEQIAEWKKALKTCASGKSYTIGTRTLTRQDAGEIMKTLDRLRSELIALSSGRGPVIVHACLHHEGRNR